MKSILYAVLLVFGSCGTVAVGAPTAGDLYETVMLHHLPGELYDAKRPICHLSIARAIPETYDRIYALDLPFTVKTEGGYLWRDGVLYDAATDRPCSKLTIFIDSMTTESAVIVVEWAQTSKGGGGRALRFRSEGGKWVLDQVLSGFSV